MLVANVPVSPHPDRSIGVSGFALRIPWMLGVENVPLFLSPGMIHVQ